MAEVNNQENNVQENEAKLTEDVQVEQQDEQNKKDDTGKHIAVTSILLGLLALLAGIPVIGMIFGFAGLGGAVKAFKPGSRILAVIAFVVSIFGTIRGIADTVHRFFPQVDLAETVIYWLSNIL